MTSLKDAVRTYAGRHANEDGLALTPMSDLRMMCVDTPGGVMHSVYRPLICLVLQGAKRIVVGTEDETFSAGQAVIVSADMPVAGRIVRASPAEPYIAVAIELDMPLIRELSAEMDERLLQQPPQEGTLFVEDTGAALLGCIERLMRLIDRPQAAPLLKPGIMKELHYWLLAGPYGGALVNNARRDSRVGRLAPAITLLRSEFRSKLPIARLAEAVAMSPTAFHKHFKAVTSLTPTQYQKRLRLIEARRLMREKGLTASMAAFEVGYESSSHFTRDYGRLFNAPPKRDALKARGSTPATLGPGPKTPSPPLHE
ncbi:AraC family transcriptional regulator [Pseudorhizobium sp. NPDC055634]